jgi:hypothetical protein
MFRRLPEPMNVSPQQIIAEIVAIDETSDFLLVLKGISDLIEALDVDCTDPHLINASVSMREVIKSIRAWNT